MPSYLEDLTGKHLMVNGVPYPDRKTLELTLPGATVTDVPSRGATAIAYESTVSTPVAATLPLVLSAANLGTVVACTNAASSTVTVPNDSTLVAPVGAIVFIHQQAAGPVQIVAGSGVTLRYLAGRGLYTVGQWAMASLRKIGANEWLVGGEVGP